MLKYLSATRFPKSILGRAIWILAVAFVLICTGLAATGFVAHSITPSGYDSLKLAAVAPYLMILTVPAIALVVLLRFWIGVIGLVVLASLCVRAEAPLFHQTNESRGHVTLRIMTADLQGAASPASLLNATRDHNVEVLITPEVASAELAHLIRNGIGAQFPYHLLSVSGSIDQDVSLWSRYPLRKKVIYRNFSRPILSASIRDPSTARQITLVGVKMPAPDPNFSEWTSDMSKLRILLQTMPASATALVGGDFDSTYDMREYRSLLTNGYADASEESGGGLDPTFPSGTWYPPLLGFDRVITRNCTAVSTDTIELRGTNHRALLVAIALK